MAEIITSAAFNDKFVVGLDACGNPVQRTLAEMSADQVIAAGQWLLHEIDRLDELSVRYGREDLSLELAAEQAMQQPLRLMDLLYVAMPQGRQHSALSWHEAVRRYWPHGRAP
jgi:hypothetical protein